MEGTGGALFVQQLKAAGVRYIFFNPSTRDSPIFDALVDEPSIQLIKGVHESAVVAMADGYARATGKLGVVIVADVGLPNALSMMVNAHRDRIPLLIVAATADQEGQGSDTMVGPVSKGARQARTPESIPEVTRGCIADAATAPSGPIYLAFPGEILAATASAAIAPIEDRAQTLRPDAAAIEAAARSLIEAQNPVLWVGDEVATCHAEAETLALAELLGLQVAAPETGPGYWTKAFPTRHPLHLGGPLRPLPYPQPFDVLLNLGSANGGQRLQAAKRIAVRADPSARNAIVADVKLATAALIDAAKSLATSARLDEIAAARRERAAAYTQKRRAELDARIAKAAARPEIGVARLGAALEAGLASDTIYVADVDSGEELEPYLSFGGADKTFIGIGARIKGWGMAAAFGVKLGQPDRPVLALGGDGSFLFSGPMPLWSMARYRAPVMVLVLNNGSYNNERHRIWNTGGRQAKAERDMTCHLGDPDVDYAATARSFGVEAETVEDGARLDAAIARARRVTAEGRPYLLDVHLERAGHGAKSPWHPEYSVAALRTRSV
jgi:benzoylformate decarboxylase